MFKYYKVIFFLFLALFLVKPALAENKVDVYFFHGEGCPHCAEEDKFLKVIERTDKEVVIHRYEIWKNRQNANFLTALSKAYGWNIQGVPFTVIGDKVISGYLNEETTGKTITDTISVCGNTACPDLVGNYLKDGKTGNDGQTKNEKIEKITLPVFGEINVRSFSLPLLTIVIGGLDGFNPCALWVLLFLISMLIGMKEKKKMLILGSAFILTSAVFYFLVLAAWLNFLLFIGLINWIRWIIGVVALYAAYINLDEYLFKDDRTCEVVDETKRKKIFTRVKEIIAKEKIWLALAGIIFLAISVNLFELVCSAGLPAVYAQILAFSELTKPQYYSYLLLYVFVFVLNQIIIFSIAFYSFKLRAINPKFIRWFGIIGGFIMLILGILLLFKPNWLMFG